MTKPRSEAVEAMISILDSAAVSARKSGWALVAATTPMTQGTEGEITEKIIGLLDKVFESSAKKPLSVTTIAVLEKALQVIRGAAKLTEDEIAEGRKAIEGFYQSCVGREENEQAMRTRSFWLGIVSLLIAANVRFIADEFTDILKKSKEGKADETTD